MSQLNEPAMGRVMSDADVGTWDGIEKAKHLATLAVQLYRAQAHYMTPTVSGTDLDAAYERLTSLQKQYEAALQAYEPFVKEEP